MSNDPGRFLLGDTESKGFLHYCFQVKHGCHYFCCLFLETLNKLLSKSHNSNSDRFIKILSSLPLAKIKSMGIGIHLESSGNRRCQQFTFEVIRQLETLNPRTSYVSLFVSPKMKGFYASWKEKNISSLSHQVMNPSHAEESGKLDSDIRSAAQVFCQPIGVDEFLKKKSYFVQQAQLYFSEQPDALDSIKVVVSIENFDMAALSSTIPGISVPKLSTKCSLEEEVKTREDKVVYSEKSREETPKDCWSLSTVSNIEAYKNASDERAVIETFKNGITQLKIRHKSDIFILKISKSSCQGSIWPSSKKIKYLFNFSSSDLSVLEEHGSPENNPERKTSIERKISISCNCCEGSAMDKSCLSSTSTRDASERGIQTPIVEVVCNIEGELALFNENPTNNTGPPVVSMNLFVLAKDQATKQFIRVLPEIRHVMKHAFLQIVENSMEA